MKFRHFILCRYNLTLFSQNVYKIEDPEGWMDRRRVYFDWLTTSLGAQTCANFHFVLFIDPSTPKAFVDDLNSMMSNKIQSYRIYKGYPFDWIKELNIKEQFLITSRIDCDDYYFPTFVETVQSEFKGETEVLDVYGLQYDCKSEDFYTSGRSRPNSPFISLVEQNVGRVSVYHRPHSNMPEYVKARFIGDEPQYVQVIHDENIKNAIKGSKL